MIRFLFLLPLVLCLLWFLFLRSRGYSVEQGKQGFLYILIFSGVIALFYSLLLWLTHIE